AKPLAVGALEMGTLEIHVLGGVRLLLVMADELGGQRDVVDEILETRAGDGQGILDDIGNPVLVAEETIQAESPVGMLGAYAAGDELPGVAATVAVGAVGRRRPELGRGGTSAFRDLESASL